MLLFINYWIVYKYDASILLITWSDTCNHKRKWSAMNRTQKFGIGVGVVLVSLVLILGYFGFVPVLSDLMGANKGRDLGIKFTAADYDSARSKLGFTLGTNPADAPPVDSITIEGFKPVTATLTSAELTALVNKLAEKWRYCPLENAQVRINSDGSLEIQGTLLLGRFNGFAQAINMPDSILGKFSPILAVIQTNPSFYMKCSLSITNGVAQSLINEIQIGKVDIPAADLPAIQSSFNSFLERVAQEPTGLIRNVSFGDGVINIEGNLPTEISLSPP